MEDFITYCHVSKFNAWLKEMEKELGEGGTVFPTYIPIQYYKDGNKKVSLCVTRCVEREDFDKLNLAVQSGTLELMGRVENNRYIFNSEEWQDKYEKLRKVGKYREYEVKRDEEGRVILDKDGNTIKEPTSHPYMQGVFA